MLNFKMMKNQLKLIVYLMSINYNYHGTSFKPIKYATVFAMILTEGVKMRRKIIINMSGAK